MLGRAGSADASSGNPACHDGVVGTQRRGPVAALAALVAVSVLAGCGSASDPSPPTGVDGLVVPTPSPDPDDFVAEVDNPWLPLRVGARWEYAATGAPRTGEPRAVRVVTVEEGPVVAGVATASVVTVSSPGGRRTTETVDHYAQDEDGNVWWFGREGEWQAGSGGVGAGLAMPAEPRYADGFRAALVPGVLDVRVRVLAVDEEQSVPAGEYDDLVALEHRTSPGGAVEVRYYAAGTGLVGTAPAPGSEPGSGGPALGLLAHEQPRA